MNSRKVVIVMVILVLGIIGASLLIKPSDEKASDSNSGKNTKTETAEKAESNEIREAIDKMYELYNLSNVIDGDIMKEGFRKGISMGDMLEAPNEGDWGVTFDPEYFRLIKEQGFDFVRIPIKWSAHLNIEKFLNINDLNDLLNGWIEEDFLERVDYIINCALENELGVVINIQNFNETINVTLSDGGSFNVEPFVIFPKIWAFLGNHYQNMPDSVLFEIFGEPNGSLETWNAIQTGIYSTIRESNSKRGIILQIGYDGGYIDFNRLHIPKDDKNVILSFNFFNPSDFTQQSVTGKKWTNDETERKRIDAVFNNIKSFAQATGLPVFLEEFGVNGNADIESRVMWTRYVRETAEKYGFTWCYWEFCSDFGIFDRQTMTFNERLSSALLEGKKDSFNKEKGNVRVTYTTFNWNLVSLMTSFAYQRKMDIMCLDWTNMLLYDTNNNTQIVSVKGASNGGYLLLPLSVFYYNVNGAVSFSKNTVELTVKNLNDSITDLRISLTQNKDDDEIILYDNDRFNETATGIYDGKTTITLKMDKSFTDFEDNFALFLKVYIETVPERKDDYDRTGSLEFVEMQVY